MFQKDIFLSGYSSYKIGGKAKYFYEAKGLNDLLQAVELAKKKSLAVFVLGGGTNLLIDDNGFDGLVLKPNIKFIQKDEIMNNELGIRVMVGAGILASDLLNFCIDHSLSGLEWAGGLPGTIGGAIRGNAGAFGGEIKDSIKEVISLDINNQRLIKRNNNQCEFSYRNSIFKQVKKPVEIIISATFNLILSDQNKIKTAIEEKIYYRHQKHPMEYPNIGSTFKNINLELVPKKYQEKFAHKIKKDPMSVLPTAVLIDQCNLRGVSFGGAMISPKHPNFIVNALGATASDVKKLIELMKAKVKSEYDIDLEEEVQSI